MSLAVCSSACCNENPAEKQTPMDLNASGICSRNRTSHRCITLEACASINQMVTIARPAPTTTEADTNVPSRKLISKHKSNNSQTMHGAQPCCEQRRALTMFSHCLRTTPTCDKCADIGLNILTPLRQRSENRSCRNANLLPARAPASPDSRARVLILWMRLARASAAKDGNTR